MKITSVFDWTECDAFTNQEGLTKLETYMSSILMITPDEVTPSFDRGRGTVFITAGFSFAIPRNLLRKL